MKKAERLAAMVRVLRSCGRCTAVALAERLGVTVRTVYRDAEVLRAAGLPLRGTRGQGYAYVDDVPVAVLALEDWEQAAVGDALTLCGLLWERERWRALASRVATAQMAGGGGAGRDG